MSSTRTGLRTLAALAAVALAGIAADASAQPSWGYGQPPPPPPPHYGTPHTQTPGLDRQQALQREWLRQGIASGRITPREAERIRAAIRDLERHERAAKADGYVTPQERRALREHAARVDALISRNYYDGQVRPPLYADVWR